MILAEIGIIPPEKWRHEPSLTNPYEKTVAELLIDNKIAPPGEWAYNIDKRYKFGQIMTMRIA